MRIIRIYQPGMYHLGDTVFLNPEAVQHVVTVLRLRIGQQLILFRGDHQEYLAQIVSLQKRNVEVLITQVTVVNRESPLNIHLAQGISKGDRMEWVVQKAVEIGVVSITPILTARSVVRIDRERMLKKESQWQAIAIHACEQCGRNYIPVIHPTQTISQFITETTIPNKWILSPDAQQSLKDYPNITNDITVLIGPEGGLSQEEVTLAIRHDFKGLRLGPRVLRTETAAVAALSILQAQWGDW